MQDVEKLSLAASYVSTFQIISSVVHPVLTLARIFVSVFFIRNKDTVSVVSTVTAEDEEGTKGAQGVPQEGGDDETGADSKKQGRAEEIGFREYRPSL